MPTARARSTSFRASVSGGPNKLRVPAMSIPQAKATPSPSSSTRGENPPAHSSCIARVAASSSSERASTAAAGKVSTSTRVMPRAIPSSRACAFREQICSSGASPSITTHGCSRSSGRSRSSACAGNSRAYRHAYNSAVIAHPPMPCGSASLRRALPHALFAEACAAALHFLPRSQIAAAPPPRNVPCR